MQTTTIDLLRHGEAAGGHYFRGSTDDPLTRRGFKQMEAAIAALESWDLIISSPLLRCHEFAEAISRQYAIPLQTNPQIQEIHFGDWEGKTAPEIESKQALALNNFYANPEQHPPPNGENHAKFHSRIVSAWRSIIANHQGHHILMITHAGVIRELFSHLLTLSFQNSFHIQLNHASLTRFEIIYTSSSDFVQLVSHQPGRRSLNTE